MRDTFDHDIHPTCEEDLIYPDEGSEFLSELEVLEEKLRVFEQRKEVKNLTQGRLRRLK